jgi:hypothetical protein
MSHRLNITFTDAEIEMINTLVRECDFVTKGSAVRTAVRIVATLQQDMARGYSEIVMRNPDTGEQRGVIFVSLILLRRIDAEDS